jgi:hypothetical protein
MRAPPGLCLFHRRWAILSAWHLEANWLLLHSSSGRGVRFVPVKMAEQHAAVLLHRGREQLLRQRTMLVMRCGHIWRSSG